MNPITITSYNIHKGMSPLNRVVKLDGMAAALKTIAPDILCLQEVQGQHLKRAIFDNYPKQSHSEWLGECLMCNGAYGKNAQYPYGHHGNAVLSCHSLDFKHNLNITLSRLEQRGVLHCEVLPAGWDCPVVVLCTHLNLRHKDRVRQYQAMVEYIQTAIDKDAPLIVAGDFNDWTGRSGEWLQTVGLIEVFEQLHGKCPATFPAVLPVLSLDRIYVRHLSVHHATVHANAPWSGLSDHLPISAVVSMVD